MTIEPNQTKVKFLAAAELTDRVHVISEVCAANVRRGHSETKWWEGSKQMKWWNTMGVGR